MNIFEYTDYRRFLREHLESQPKKGRGQAKKIAEQLGTHGVVISQVLAGSRDFTLEQAAELSEYLGLSEIEEDYILTLVQWERAGSHRLKKIYQKKIDALKKRAEKVEERVPKDRELDDQAKATYYSSWHYSAVRILCSLDDVHAAEQIAEHFHLPISKVREVLQFLKQQQLIRMENGRIELQAKTTHIGQNTAYSAMHHKNWRLKAMQMKEVNKESDMFYTAPLSLSREDFVQIRSSLVKMIEGLTQKVAASGCEQTACLNIDWFEF